MAFAAIIVFDFGDSADASRVEARAKLPSPITLPAIIRRREHVSTIANGIGLFLSVILSLILFGPMPNVFAAAPNSLFASLPQGVPVVPAGNRFGWVSARYYVQGPFRRDKRTNCQL